MAWTVQFLRADKLEVLLFLLGSMAVSCSSSEQSFSRFINNVRYLQQHCGGPQKTWYRYFNFTIRLLHKRLFSVVVL